MKTVRLVWCIALTLCAGTAGMEARACGLGFHVGLPCLSFGVGLGLGFGAAYSCPAYDCGYSYPVYAYNPPLNYIPPATAVPSAAPVPQTPAWTPRSPGAGRWVPDSEPYRCAPVSAARKTSAAASAETGTVTVTRFPGGVPVYRVQLVSQQH